jgi:threonine aldolase
MNFTSDNSGPAHPFVIAALAQANEGYASGYGADAATERLTAQIRKIFEAPDAAVFLVGTGTAANALALSCLAPPWAAIFAHRHAHVEEDECGAIGFFTGGSPLSLLPGAHGRIDPDALAAAAARKGVSVHQPQRGAVTLTQATEAGAVYPLEHIRAIAAIARAQGMPLHMDGARFTNALVSLGCTPAEMTWRAGVDALSFGGTKNGLVGVEAVLFFDPLKAWEFELRRKRAGHLFSKHRYLTAQMDAYLAGDLWLGMARTANRRAARLAARLAGLPGARLDHPVEANEVFVTLPRAAHRRAHASGAQYHLWSFDDPAGQTLEGPDDAPVPARLVCNWATTEAEIDALVDAFGARAAARSA